MDENADWIRDRHKERYTFIDVGGDNSPNKSHFYAIEKQTLHEIDAKVYKEAPKAIAAARKNSIPSDRPSGKVLCPP